MRKIIIVQSIPMVLRLVRERIGWVFPELEDVVVYQSDFETTLNEIPQDGEFVVITSDQFYDESHVKFTAKEKDGNKLAEEIKKINPKAKVYCFSGYEPPLTHLDGLYHKSADGDNTVEEIVFIFMDLGLDKESI